MFGVGSIIKAVLALVIVLVVAGGLWYIINLKADLAVSEMNAKTLQEATEKQNALIEKMQADIAQIQQINKQLVEQNEKQKADVDALAKKFDKRDFGGFVVAQPSKAEGLINRGTKNVLRCLEIASGAPLTDAEKNAKTPTEANRECPSLINPNYTASN